MYNYFVNLFSTWCLTLIFTSVVMAGTSTSFPAFPFLVSLWSPPSVARGLRSQVGLPGCAGGDCGCWWPCCPWLCLGWPGLPLTPRLQLSSAHSFSSFLHISFKTDFRFFLSPSSPRHPPPCNCPGILAFSILDKWSVHCNCSSAMLISVEIRPRI